MYQSTYLSMYLSIVGGYFQCNRFQSGAGGGADSVLEGREDHQEDEEEEGGGADTILGKSATEAYFAMFPDEGTCVYV